MIEKIIITIIVVVAGLFVFKKMRDLASGKDDSCANCANLNCMSRKKRRKRRK